MRPQSASWRFRSRETEPFMPSQAPGQPWFTVKRVSKEEYNDMVDKKKRDMAAQRAAEEAASGEPAAPPKRSLKEKYDTMEDKW